MTDMLFHIALTAGDLQLYLIGFLGFVVAFGLAVFVHELGHFLAAKAFGVPVERFVIGFDKDAIAALPRCIIEKKVGETVYGISLVPLGGYVKMSGTIHPEIERYLDGVEAPDPASLSGQAVGDINALYKRPFYQKFIIYGAGVVMNIILAMIVVAFMNWRGTMVDLPLPAKIAFIAPDSAYAATPLKPGDLITAVNGKAVADSDVLFTELAALQPAEKDAKPAPAKLTLKRADGTEYTHTVTLPDTDEQATDFNTVFSYNPAYVDFVVPNQPADKAGIAQGDTVVSINGEPVIDWAHLVWWIRKSSGVELNLEIRRGDQTIKTTMKPWESSDAKGIGQVGILRGNPEKRLEALPLGAAIADAPHRVMILTINYANALKGLGGKLLGGNVKAVQRELGGPVGIAQLAYRHARQGLNDWLRFLVLLNIALAVMNSLPIPILDGGHICFAIYEAIFRRPVPPKILVPVLNGALVFLLVFLVFVTFNDLFKIFI